MRLTLVCLFVLCSVIYHTQAVSYDVALITDFHYDPVYGTKQAYGTCTSATSSLFETGCDSPLKLIQSALNDASSLSNAFTIFGGDWQRHEFDKTDLKTASVFDTISKELSAVVTSGLPSDSSNVCITLGNNDFEKDYTFNISATSHTYLLEQISAMKSNGVLTEEEGSVMSECGFYTHKSAGFWVVSLNTLVWAYSIVPAISNDSDPCGQFAYLQSQLEEAEKSGVKVIILGHIPPTVKSYNVIQQGSFTSEAVDMHWKKSYQDKYFSLIQQYSSTVSTHLYGHTHVFSVIAVDELAVPGFIVPSISPVFGNNPSYLVASFTSDWKLRNVRQRYLNGTEWVEGLDVAAAMGFKFGFQNFTDMKASVTRMGSDDRTWGNYLSLHSGGRGNLYSALPSEECRSFCRALLICGMTQSNVSALEACTSSVLLTENNGEKVSTGESVLTALLLILVPLAAISAILLKQMYPKLRAGKIDFFPDIDWGQQLTGRKRKSKKSTVDAPPAGTAAFAGAGLGEEEEAKRQQGENNVSAIEVEPREEMWSDTDERRP